MIRRYATLVAAVATLAPLGATMSVGAQVPPAQQAQQQQMQRMQEQMQRIDQTMQRMTQLQQRAQEMEQVSLRDMERLHQQEGLQVRSQEQLRTQEQIRTMAHALAGAAGEMTQAMNGLREMARTSDGTMDRAMEQQMDRLREHMQETCDQMEDGLRIMEQLRDRLNQK
jgi:hypothetical protein